jgi:hypothetical protein
MAITLDGTNGITTPDVDTDGLTVDTNTLFVDAANNRVGIGTSSPASPLHVVGASMRVGSVSDLDNFTLGTDKAGGALLFRKSENTTDRYLALGSVDNSFAFTERVRIDEAGKLLVGVTSSSTVEKIAANGNAAGSDTAFIQNDNSTAFNASVLVLGAIRNTTNSTFNFLTCVTQNVAFRLHIRDSGNVVNQNNSYGAISDAKLKENIVDATPKLRKLNQVRVVNYNLIGEEQKQLGVIAQELEQIFPSIVEEAPDRDTEGNDLGTTTKSVKYSVFVPMLIKAMQEQQSIIEALEARVAALETNA